MKIFVFDPDEYYQELLSRTFSEFAEVRGVKKSKDFFVLVEESCPDLVIIEMLHPEETGYELIQKLRENNQVLPVIVYSKAGKLDDIKETFSLGISGYFVKGRDHINDMRRLILNLKDKNYGQI